MPNWSIWASTWAWCAWRADKFSLFHTKPLWEGASPLPHLNRGALTVPGARAVLAAFHISILKVRIVLTAAREGGLFQVALTELGLLQISIAQIRPLQVGLAQPGHFQVGGAQVGLVHLCPGQPGELQVSRAQVGVFKLRALGEQAPTLDRHQRGAGEIGQAQVALLQAGAGQVGAL